MREKDCVVNLVNCGSAPSFWTCEGLLCLERVMCSGRGQVSSQKDLAMIDLCRSTIRCRLIVHSNFHSRCRPSISWVFNSDTSVSLDHNYAVQAHIHVFSDTTSLRHILETLVYFLGLHDIHHIHHRTVATVINEHPYISSSMRFGWIVAAGWPVNTLRQIKNFKNQNLELNCSRVGSSEWYRAFPPQTRPRILAIFADPAPYLF